MVYIEEADKFYENFYNKRNGNELYNRNKEIQKLYKLKNIDRIKKIAKKYYEENKEKINLKRRKLYHENKMRNNNEI